MRLALLLTVVALAGGCGSSAEVERLKNEAAIARAETERVKAQAEADRLKAELESVRQQAALEGEKLKIVEDAVKQINDSFVTQMTESTSKTAQPQEEPVNSTEPSIVGKWQMRGLPNTLEFFADGIMRETGSAKATDSRYRLLSHNRMETESPGILSGTNRFEWNYQLSFDGKSLTLTPNSVFSVAMTLDRIQ